MASKPSASHQTFHSPNVATLFAEQFLALSSANRKCRAANWQGVVTIDEIRHFTQNSLICHVV
jgi:hypothetical protein